MLQQNVLRGGLTILVRNGDSTPSMTDLQLPGRITKTAQCTPEQNCTSPHILGVFFCILTPNTPVVDGTSEYWLYFIFYFHPCSSMITIRHCSTALAAVVNVTVIVQMRRNDHIVISPSLSARPSTANSANYKPATRSHTEIGWWDGMVRGIKILQNLVMLMVTNSLRKYSALNLLEINLKLSSLGLTEIPATT